MKFDRKNPDYSKINPDMYNVSEIFAKEKTWKKISSRKADSVNFTDLLCPYYSSQCPHCESIIPIADFNNKKCSICGCVLSPLGQEQIDLEKDTDGDGISDVKEVELGLNPNDPSDAEADLDKDGFANIFEYKRGTNLKDPKSHPPTAFRLFVESIDRKKLRFFLKKITRKGESKEKWDIQTVEWVPEKRRMDDKFRKIGSEMIIEGSVYKIIDIIPKEKELFDDKTGVKTSEDASQILIQTGKEEPIIVNMKSDAYENKETIIISDSFTNQKFKLILNEKFSVPTPAAESDETYVLSKILDRETLKVQIIDENSKEVFEIGAEPVHRPKINESVTPKTETNQNTMDIPF